MRNLWVVMLSLLVLSSCSREPEELVLSTNSWFGYMPLYVARDAGFYEDTPLRLVLLPSSSESIRALRDGEVDAAGLTLDEALLLADSGAPVCIPLILDYSNGADALVAKPRINTISQLAGKSVGVENSAVGAHLLNRALQSAGLSLDQVSVVPLELHEQINAYNRNEVDAVVTFDPVRSLLLQQGARQLFSSADIPGEVTDVLVVDRDYLRKNPEAVNRIINGWFRITQELGEGNTGLKARLARYSGLEPESIAETLQLLIFPGRDANRAALVGEHARFRKLVMAMNETLIEQGAIAGDVDPERLLCPAGALQAYH